MLELPTVENPHRTGIPLPQNPTFTKKSVDLQTSSSVPSANEPSEFLFEPRSRNPAPKRLHHLNIPVFNTATGSPTPGTYHPSTLACSLLRCILSAHRSALSCLSASSLSV